MVPLIELRGAIPVAYGIHAANPDFSLLWSYVIIAVGNILPVPFIYLFARKVLEWGKDKKYIGKFFTWCLEKGEKGGQNCKPKPDADSTGRWFCSSAYRYREQAPGQALSPQVFWIWASRKALLPSSVASS